MNMTLQLIAKKLVPSSLLQFGSKHIHFWLLGFLGVALLLLGGMYDSFSSQTVKLKAESTAENKNTPVPIRSYEEIMEGKLANVLSQIRGVGAVTVSITVENAGILEHAKNTVKESRSIQEKDNAGGIRTTTEMKENEQILLSKENGADRPVMIRETKPLIKGVLVIAEGAYDSSIKANITKAVEAALGIPAYRVSVLPQRK